MNLENNLRFLEISKEFRAIKVEEGYEICYNKYDKLSAIIDKEGNVNYYITGVYNSGSDYAEIDIERLELLKEFINLLKSE